MFARLNCEKKRENFKKAPCANRILWFNYFCSKGNRERKPLLPFSFLGQRKLKKHP